MNQNTLRELKNSLEKEKDMLISELKTIAARDPKVKGDWDVKHSEWEENEITSDEELEAGVSANEADEDMKNKALSDDLELRLRDVNSALDKIEKGNYGICETCGGEIPEERLKADPAAKTDIEHAK